MPDSNNKVFILGLDGGTWKILNPLIEEGKMPNLKKLVEGGASGNLRSTIPPITAPAWTSFQTGVNPGKHGIFDFLQFNHKTKQARLVNSNSILIKTIWDIASASGKKIITINVPLTYPTKEDPNRITISCFLTPKECPDMIYPRELFEKYIKGFKYKIFDEIMERSVLSYDIEDIVKKKIEIERKRFFVTKQLMKEYKWDLCMLHVHLSDTIQHWFYPYLDPSSSKFDKNKHIQLSEFYQAIDSEIGDLIETFDESVDFIMLSDHGFKETKKYVNINAWLKSQGLLRISRPSFILELINFVKKYDKLKLLKIFFGKFLRSKTTFILGDVSARFNNKAIDWENTKAFAPYATLFGGVFINDRYRTQIVKNEILEKLNKFIDPDTGTNIVEKVYFKEDIYSGPYVDSLPDIVIQLCDDYICSFPSVNDKNIFNELSFKYPRPGNHDLNGIVIFYGKRFKKGVQIKANIIDVAPTILKLLGIEIPSYMDGILLKDVFNDKIDIKVKEESLTEISRKNIVKNRGSDSIEVEKRLKSLGYL